MGDNLKAPESGAEPLTSDNDVKYRDCCPTKEPGPHKLSCPKADSRRILLGVMMPGDESWLAA